MKLLFLIFISLSFYLYASDWKAAYAPKTDKWKSVKQDFIFNNEAEPETLDPQSMSDFSGIRIAMSMYEGLLSQDPKTLKEKPGMAESWTISDDGLTYIFKIRRNAKWNDGSKLTAYDFEKSWLRAISKEISNPYVNLLFLIKSVKNFRDGRATKADLGFKAIDEHTFKVTLNKPSGYFLSLMSFPTFYPVRTDLIKKHGIQWLKAENHVSNGPFTMTEWLPKQHILMTKSKHYWDRDFIKLNSVKALAIKDRNTALEAFDKGDVHYMAAIPVSKIDEIKFKPEYHVSHKFGTYFFRFNVTKPPFDDKRVRKAFSLAINRQSITKYICKGGEKPITSFCPPIVGYEPVKGFEYDKVKAKQLLKEAGYGPSGKPFPEVTVLFNTKELEKDIVQKLSQQWEANLGIRVKTENKEWKVYLKDMKLLSYDLCRSSWTGDYPHPSTFMDCFVTGDGNNRTGWSSPEYDRLAEQARSELEPQKRDKLYHQMERILVEEECPIMPIYRCVTHSLRNDSVHGIYSNIQSRHNFKFVWLE